MLYKNTIIVCIDKLMASSLKGLRQALHQSPGTSPRTKMTVSPATSEKNSSSRTSSQGSMEGLTEEKGDAEKITAATGVVRRRPSFERAKKGQ